MGPEHFLRGATQPEGIAQAFIIGEEFIGNDSCALVLGDNIFYGHDLPSRPAAAAAETDAAPRVFAYPVQDPERYGVVEFDSDRQGVSIEEKPDKAQVPLRRDRTLFL